MAPIVRNYLIGLGLLGLAVLGSWIANHDSRIGEINDLLADDAELAAYPYHFHALTIVGTTATLSSPRSALVPATRFLAIINPGLAGRSSNDPDLIAAQKELARLQGRAGKLVMARPDIEQVRWELDRDWYSAHGVMLQ